MKIEIIVIGNELLQGKIQDKNAQWLAKRLLTLGHQLQAISIVADLENDLMAALATARKRSDLVFTSGGLGPTKDDITKDIFVKFFKAPLYESKRAHLIIEKQYTRHNREYDAKNSDYHLIPKDFTPIYNPAGFAPGLQFEKDGVKLFSAPGVPSEFHAMVEANLETLLPSSKEALEPFTIKTFKVAESKIFNSIIPNLWEYLETFGDVSSLAHYAGVDIGILLKGTQKEIDTKKKELIAYFDKSALKKNIYHYGNESLEQVIVSLALSKKVTFGFAESCTGGLNSSRITDIGGCSAVYMGSVTSYSNEIKQSILGVDSTTLELHGAVSEKTAVEMAIGAREKLNIDIAISTTGIAGPSGGSKEKPVGTVAIGIATKNESSAKIFNYTGDRESLKLRFSQAALISLLETLLA
jgi:nicotinamide-nucleotide amidase